MKCGGEEGAKMVRVGMIAVTASVLRHTDKKTSRLSISVGREHGRMEALGTFYEA